MKKAAILFLAGCLSCTVALTTEQARVRVTTNNEASRGCKLIGNVDGDSQWADEALREVQRRA